MASKIKEYEGDDDLFLRAFALAKDKNSKLQLTRRQHARWRQGRGQAFACRAEATAQMHGQEVA